MSNLNQSNKLDNFVVQCLQQIWQEIFSYPPYLYTGVAYAFCKVHI